MNYIINLIYLILYTLVHKHIKYFIKQKRHFWHIHYNSSIWISKKKNYLHALQCGVVHHTPNRKNHVGNVEDTKPLLETLSQGIYKAKERQDNTRDIRQCVEKLGNVRRPSIVRFAPICGRHRTPEARNRVSHFQFNLWNSTLVLFHAEYN